MPLMRAPLLMVLGLLFAGSEAFGKVLKKQVSVALLGCCFQQCDTAGVVWVGMGYWEWLLPAISRILYLLQSLPESQTVGLWVLFFLVVCFSMWGRKKLSSYFPDSVGWSNNQIGMRQINKRK